MGQGDIRHLGLSLPVETPGGTRGGPQGQTALSPLGVLGRQESCVAVCLCW